MRSRLTRAILQQLHATVLEGARTSWGMTITSAGEFIVEVIPDPGDAFPYSGDKDGVTACLYRYAYRDAPEFNEDLVALGEQLEGINPDDDWWMVLFGKDHLCASDRIAFVRFDENKHDAAFLEKFDETLGTGLVGRYTFSGEIRVVMTN